jgi:hypothetical protein
VETAVLEETGHVPVETFTGTEDLVTKGCANCHPYCP